MNSPTTAIQTEIDFASLKLQPDAVMQAQAMGESSHARHEVRYIGFIKDKSVLTSLPFVEGQGMWLTPGKAFILRGFNGTHAFAFSTLVVRAHTNPFPYVHFAWPHEIELQLVRKSQRVLVSLPAQVTLADNRTVAVTLTDLSALGSMLDSAEPLGEIDDKARIEFSLNLDGNVTVLNIAIKLRNIHHKPDGSGLRIGVGFEEITQNETLILHYFIHSLAQAPRE